MTQMVTFHYLNVKLAKTKFSLRFTLSCHHKTIFYKVILTLSIKCSLRFFHKNPILPKKKHEAKKE